MTYKALTEQTAIELALSLNLIDGDVTSTEIGDGNLNLVFHIRRQGEERGIIIKQALPYAKVVGESWPLTLDRARIEAEALEAFAQYVPHLVPKVLYRDDALAITVLEDLSHLTIARKGLIDGAHYPKLASDIGTFLAQILFFTSDYGHNQQAKKQWTTNFINPELCKITEDLVFTDPFFDHETNNFEAALRPIVEKLWADHELKREVAKLKVKFLTNQDALLHGDLHTGSIFASETETKVIDPEFAYFGPKGFDVGQFFANLLLNAISAPENFSTRLAQIDETWTTLTEEFTRLFRQSTDAFAQVDGVLDDYFAELYEDALGFAGAEVIRRTIGLAHVADLDGIADEPTRLARKEDALHIGATLIKQRRNIRDILSLQAELLENQLA